MSESELYKKLGLLTKNRNEWEENIPYVSSLLDHDSVKIQAKALWLRERAVNALGRIGRGSYQAVECYWKDMFRFASDEEAKVRLSFIWASENIATNTPDIYEKYMPVFEKLLHDEDDKVRMEAPEMFRVLGKRRPEFVRPYVEQLQHMSETDKNQVVRIHCLGAIKAMEKRWRKWANNWSG